MCDSSLVKSSIICFRPSVSVALFHLCVFLSHPSLPLPAFPAATTIYQTIDEVGTSTSSRGASPLPPLPTSSSSPHSQQEGGTTRDQPSEAGATGGGRGGGGGEEEANITSPPLVPEEIVPDPNATYAAVSWLLSLSCNYTECESPYFPY